MIHQWTGTENEWDVRDLKEAQEVAKIVSKCAGHMSGPGGRELAAQLANDHPTLQQKTMVMVMAFINEMAQKPYVDARNQASHDLAKNLMAVMEERYFFNGQAHLPFI